MPVKLFTDAREPDDLESVVYRFVDLWKLEDLLKTGEFYFRRLDLMTDDEKEGLAPEDYFPAPDMHRLDVRYAREILHSQGSLAQFREAFFVSCWCLLSTDRSRICEMWKKFAKNGAAISSRYSPLKAAMNSIPDDSLIGRIWYGASHLKGWNTHRFATTKRQQFEFEQEVRTAIWHGDPLAGINRHFDENSFPHELPLDPPPADRVPEFLRRKVDLNKLVDEIVVSPYADDSTQSEVERIAHANGFTFPVRVSELASYKAFLP